MEMAIFAVVAGLALLVWSADRFIDGAASSARHFGMPSLLIGMVVVGFGTSAPEMVVSIFAALEGNPGLALGNAYGSNITNIGIILGLTAVIHPVLVQSRVLRKELPILAAVTALAAWQISDNYVSIVDSVVLLCVLTGLLIWSSREGTRGGQDSLGSEVEQELLRGPMSLRKSVMWLIIGLLLLVVSSRVLVWGAVELALGFGVSDLVIGLTVVAVGTSLPELASSIIAARRGEHEIALGNVIGSNLFNTLGVVGVAGIISPMAVGPEVFSRDILVMSALTVSLFVLGYGFRRTGRINRLEGVALVAAYAGYTGYLLATAIGE